MATVQFVCTFRFDSDTDLYINMEIYLYKHICGILFINQVTNMETVRKFEFISYRCNV